jgi:hypothetical protein
VRWLGPLAQHGFALGPFESATWRIGPFHWEGLTPGRLEVRFPDEGPYVIEDVVSGLQIFGPWLVTMKSFATTPERRVLGAWRVHSLQVTPVHVERWWSVLEHRREGAFRRERIVGGASELRAWEESGASEMWRLGGSERLRLGASEWLALGASEIAWLGGSQLALGGASALLWGGASGLAWGGASETAWLGASGLAWGGASELAWPGGSGWPLGGASEALPLGASETAEVRR